MKKVNNGHRWTEDELRQLIAGWIANESVDELGEKFGCTRYGIRKKIGQLRREGVPIPRRKAGNSASRYNKPWTQEEVEFVVRRRNEKSTTEQIAIELGRSTCGVQGIIQKLRNEGVGIRMLGQGVRRLWCVEKLKAAIAGRGLTEDEIPILRSVK